MKLNFPGVYCMENLFIEIIHARNEKTEFKVCIFFSDS